MNNKKAVDSFSYISFLFVKEINFQNFLFSISNTYLKGKFVVAS